MALQSLPNNMGIIMHADGNLTSSSLALSTLDAAGESRTFIGNVFLEGGSGSKTISSAGGGIRWRTHTTTFSNAGSTVRIGIQDVSGGLEDGTFDVYTDLVGGTDTIASQSDQFTLMQSGTKTIAHGDLIAVSIELISKGGSDSVTPSAMNLGSNSRSAGMNFPYITADSGSGPAKNASGAFGCAIEFDDGSLGWINPGILPPGAFSTSVTLYGSGSSPDEWAAVFQLPFKCRISGGYVYISSLFASDSVEIIFYSDPLGTPVAVETIAVAAADSASGASNPYSFMFSTPPVLALNTTYAIAVRATSSGTVSFNYLDFGSGNDKYKKAFPFGGNVTLMGRTDQTGAFSTIKTYYLPLFGLMIDQLDDGAGGGEGGFFIQ